MESFNRMSVSSEMQVTPTTICDALIIEPKVFSDKRGWFLEAFNAQDFAVATDLNVEFVQDNHSFSHQWVLRGLHYQVARPQGRMLRVISGVIFDVIADLRRDSPSFGKWFGMELSQQNNKQLWVPPGLAHGFLALSESVEVLYKTTDFYSPLDEVCLAWNDPIISINWPLPVGVRPNLSTKDSAGLSWDLAPKF
jgi:dTDP-4-dehydrorhamnose 3,5-epimerase